MKTLLTAACMAALLGLPAQAEPLFAVEYDAAEHWYEYEARAGDPLFLKVGEKNLIHISEGAESVAQPEDYTHTVCQNALVPIHYIRFQESALPGTAGDLVGEEKDWTGQVYQSENNPLCTEAVQIALTPAWLEGRTPLSFVNALKPDSSELKPLDSALLAKVQAQYDGYAVTRSGHLATINDGQYSLDLVQFAPKDGVAIAALVLSEAGQAVQIYERRAQVLEDGGYSWNAGDGGEYVAPGVIAALQSARGLEIYFALWAPEGLSNGALYREEDKLIYLLMEYWYYHYL